MSSRGSRVDVLETSKDWPGDDRSGGAERTRSGRMQIQTSVGAIAVVVSRELPEQPDQMALVDHDDVVQAFPAQSPHQSRRSHWRKPSTAGYPDLPGRFRITHPHAHTWGEHWVFFLKLAYQVRSSPNSARTRAPRTTPSPGRPRMISASGCASKDAVSSASRSEISSLNCLLYTSDAADDLRCVDLGG